MPSSKTFFFSFFFFCSTAGYDFTVLWNCGFWGYKTRPGGITKRHSLPLSIVYWSFFNSSSSSYLCFLAPYYIFIWTQDSFQCRSFLVLTDTPFCCSFTLSLLAKSKWTLQFMWCSASEWDVWIVVCLRLFLLSKYAKCWILLSQQHCSGDCSLACVFCPQETRLMYEAIAAASFFWAVFQIIYWLRCVGDKCTIIYSSRGVGHHINSFLFLLLVIVYSMITPPFHLHTQSIIHKRQLNTMICEAWTWGNPTLGEARDGLQHDVFPS